MKLLGIDYGLKKVGVAITNDEETIAFPRYVFQNDKNLLAKIEKISEEDEIKEVVLGKSLNYKGEPNVIMSKIEEFKKELEKELKMKVHYEDEFLTSVEATRIQGRNEMVDASAATLILKSFLDKRKND
jgi:putative Holliday junction resolvase